VALAQGRLIGKRRCGGFISRSGAAFQLFLDDLTPFFNVVPKSSRNTDSTAKSILN
jgi:hypothetical protein